MYIYIMTKVGEGFIAELVINDPGIEINPGPNSPIKSKTDASN